MPTLLDAIPTPDALRRLPPAQLPALAGEVRRELIDVVSRIGGHLGPGLGVVELTIALHYVFDTPEDKLVWDVGHQAYPHKMLTGRRERLPTIRQPGGLSGFCKREESIYDAFGAGHSSTSISAALGLAVARDLLGESHEVVAIIGDGAMSAGMAYEALNNAGAMKTRLIVILNDNEMSIAPAVGAMSRHLSQLAASRTYRQFRDIGRKVAGHLPDALRDAAKRAERYARGVGVGGGSVFEEMGMYYIGPVDGHDLETLVPLLQSVKADKHERPVLIHVVTKKGYGFAPAESNHEKYHGVGTFDPDSGALSGTKTSALSYTAVFAKQLLREAQADENIVAITAAMPTGTGLDAFMEAYPERCFDVGIAEQHAVTFAAGLAAAGMKPFVAIYSTFLQRAYDQVVHDVAIQNLPVRFAIDRAGLVGADGATHAGMFDIAYLCNLPNMVVMAAGDGTDLAHMVHTAACHDSSPISFRYPRGSGPDMELPEKPQRLEIGKARMILTPQGARIALFNFGARLEAAKKACSILETEGIAVTLADARFAKPLDMDLLLELIHRHTHVFTIEEGVCGGFATQVMHALLARTPELLPGLHPLTLPDRFQSHNETEAMYADAGMDASAIAEKIRIVYHKAGATP